MSNNIEKAVQVKETANQFFKQQKFQEAIEKYSECIQLDKENAIYYNNRSIAYFQNYQFENALQDSQKALQLDSQNVKIYVRNAQNLRQLNRVEEALKILKQNKEIEESKFVKQLIVELQQEQDQINQEQKFQEEQKINQNLINWINESKNAQLDKNTIKIQGQNNRIVIRNQNIKQEETIFFIPLDKFITEDYAFENSKINQQLKQLQAQNILAIFLLEEKQKQDSKWKPYIDGLPTNYDDNPIFFNDEQLKQLKGTSFIIALEERKQQILEDYNELCERCQDFKQFSYKEFCWARISVCSRQFQLNINNKATNALIPFADMMNHNEKSTVYYSFNEQKQGFQLQSTKPLQRGEEITISYGCKSNALLYINYGFTIKDNQNDELLIDTQFLKDDIQLKAKQRILKRERLNMTCYLKTMYNDKCNLEFYNLSRFICLQDYKFIEKLEKIHESKTGDNIFDPKKTPPISIENETAVWNKINKMCFQFFMEFPTNIEDDIKKISSDKISYDERNCLNIILGEKQILLSLINTSQKMLNLLNMSIKELMQARINKDFSMFQEYINEVIIKLKAIEEAPTIQQQQKLKE